MVCLLHLFSLAPGPVANLRSAGQQPYEITLLWDEPLAKNGEITGYTVSYRGAKDGEQPHNLAQPLNLDPDENQYRVQNLKAGYTYVFEV